MSLDLKNFSHPLVMVGCGHMGRPMLARWLKKGLSAKQVTIVKPSPFTPDDGLINTQSPDLHWSDLNWVAGLDQLDLKNNDAQSPPIFILAVRPPQFEAILPELRRFDALSPLYISVAAGIGLNFMAKHLGDNIPILRAMPNSPSQIGAGVIGLYANNACTQAWQDIAMDLLSHNGFAPMLDKESDIDIITALSGGGPAYIYALTIALAKAGKALGLDEALAQKIALATVIGTAQYMDGLDENPEDLIHHIATPKGTTEAALKQLNDPSSGLDTLMLKATKAAHHRATTLTHQFSNL